MKLYSINGDDLDFDVLPSDLSEMKSLITGYELTVSSQQKLALLYYKDSQYKNCLDLLKFCLSKNLFSTENSDRIKLTLLAYYLDLNIEKEEVTNLFTQLENTQFEKELKMLKGYYLFFEKKYDTALFCLEEDILAKNLIYLEKGKPEKVETSDFLLKGYKQYLLGDLEGALRNFVIEYDKNKKVLAYLIRLAPERYYSNQNFPTDKWIRNSPEYKLLEISQIRDKIEREKGVSKYFQENPKIEEEYFYERAKKLHLEKQYEDALEYYIKCKSNLADYQIKRILGIKHPHFKNLIEFDTIREESNKDKGNPVQEFHRLRNIRKYIDESAYLNNRAYYLYFMDNITSQMINEVKEDLQDSYDFSVGLVISHFNKALKTASSDQKKAIKYNKNVLENPEYEQINQDLMDAIKNVKSNPNIYLHVFLDYLSGKKGPLSDSVNKTVVRGIGICLALKGDRFAVHIFNYLKDQPNLEVFHRRYGK